MQDQINSNNDRWLDTDADDDGFSDSEDDFDFDDSAY